MPAIVILRTVRTKLLDYMNHQANTDGGRMFTFRLPPSLAYITGMIIQITIFNTETKEIPCFIKIHSFPLNVRRFIIRN